MFLPCQPCCCTDIVAIAIIDEDSDYDLPSAIGQRNADWAGFQARWPSSPFFLLQPRLFLDQTVGIPANWTGTGPIVVNRDEGNPSNASDYYELCDLATAIPVGFRVVVSIDSSLSMTLSTVSASVALLYERLENHTLNGQPDPITFANGRLVQILPQIEKWIQPFLTLC
jgi:hypothetical protein